MNAYATFTISAKCGRSPRRFDVRRGAAAVEFALTAPILFALVLGAVEFSRANMLVHTASIAATEAARRSIVAGATANEVRLKALSELANVGVVDATVDISPAEILDDTTQVTVNLTVPVTLRNGYGLSRIFLGKQVYKSVTLQREGQTEDVNNEVVQQDGIQVTKSNGNSSSSSNSGNGNSGSNGNGNGNNGNGNGNGGGNGSNGVGGGNGNTGSSSSSSSSSSSNSGSGSSSSGSGSSGSSSSSSNSSSSSSGSSSGSGKSSSGSSGFWGALKALLGL